MRLPSTLLPLLVMVAAADVGAQGIDRFLAPAGRVGVDVHPVYTSWDTRFGRTEAGVTGREPLGEDLTAASAVDLFPGTAGLVSAIEAMNGASGYQPIVGEALARISKDVTRVEFGAQLGVSDWLTIGAMLPWTRTRTDLAFAFRPDTINGDLGASPAGTDPTAVSTFLQGLATAESAAAANAASVCGGSPGSAACTSAQALADRTTSFHASARTAYSDSPFYPLSGSVIAGSLASSTATLDGDLTAAGLPGIGAMPFATTRYAAEDFPLLPATAESGVRSSPLGGVRGIWQAGDVEVYLTARLLGSGVTTDSTQAPPNVTYQLLATVLGRLPTGAVDDPDVLLDVGTGDGQTDVEGGLLGTLTLGRHVGLRASGRYGIQRARTLVRRIAEPENALAPYAARETVRWSPGAYFGVEAALALRLSDELSIEGEYRAFRKYRDEYELTVPGGPDPSVMEDESGVTLHEVGGTLRYETLTSWMGGRASSPFQLQARVLRAVSGGGGQTPVTARVEFGVRIFRRLWGPS